MREIFRNIICVRKYFCTETGFNSVTGIPVDAFTKPTKVPLVVIKKKLN